MYLRGNLIGTDYNDNNGEDNNNNNKDDNNNDMDDGRQMTHFKSFLIGCNHDVNL